MSTWVSSYNEDTSGFSLGGSVSSEDIDENGLWAYLIVNLKFLNHPQFHEHPQSGCYHSIDVQREVVKGELVDAQLADEGDVGGLFCRSGRKH